MAFVQRKIPAPTPTPETEDFWKAASDGKLMLRKCSACHKTHWYPRAICPFCFGDAGEWVEASGEGVLYSYSVMRRAPEPYAIAYVTLAEGPTMLTNIVQCDFDALKIGQKVKLVFTPTDGGPPVPTFMPA
jgi:uncharacterized OB-fold protein